MFRRSSRARGVLVSTRRYLRRSSPGDAKIRDESLYFRKARYDDAADLVHGRNLVVVIIVGIVVVVIVSVLVVDSVVN